MNDEVEEIKKRLDIVDFISGYLTLKKAGSNYKANCPFHQERTPSFMVSAEKQIFKCFGCGEAGDIFSFLMKMEGLNFPEALEMLANRAGVILEKKRSPEVYQKEKDTKSRIFKINQTAAQVYHKILLEHQLAEPARQYLKKRQINQTTVKDFMLGYAPAKPVLGDFLKKRGFSDQEIYQAGNPDRFKNRLIFPISDQMGNIVGFTGRVLDPEDQPKYLNTPETAIFHKSRILYGLNLAKQAIKQEKKSLVVEGQMDVIASHQAGIKTAVASSGTALTTDHLDILQRYADNIIFAFDQDLAGQNASKKSIQMAILKGMNVKMIQISEGFKDAGEIVEKDPKLWQKTVEKSVHFLDWLILEKFKDKNQALSGQEKKEIAQEILPFLAIIPDKIEQGHYIKLMTKKLDTKENLIIDALNKITKTSQKLPDQAKNKSLNPEEHLIKLILTTPNLIDKTVIKLDWKEFHDDNLSEIYKLIQSCYTKDSCSSKSFEGKGKEKCEDSLAIIKCFKSKLSAKSAEKLEYLLLEIDNLSSSLSKEELETEIINNINRIKNNNKETVKEEFAKAIKEAEIKGDIKKVKALLLEFQNALK